MTEVQQSVVADTLLATEDAGFALNHLKMLLGAHLIQPLVYLVGDAGGEGPVIDLPNKSLQLLLSSEETSAPKLITALVSTSSKVAKRVANILLDAPKWREAKFLPTIELLLDLSAVADLALSDICALAVQAAYSHDDPEIANAAVRCLARISTNAPQLLVDAVVESKVELFRLSTAHLARTLAQAMKPELNLAVKHLIDAGLQYAVRACATRGNMTPESLEIIRDLGMLSVHLFDVNLTHRRICSANGKP
jgi:hypothetical protein